MEQKKVFFCYKCNELYYSSNAAALKCPNCKGSLTPLDVSSDKWEFMSDEDHNEILRTHMPSTGTESKQDEKAPGKAMPVRFCLFCKKAYIEGETQCPSCRGPLVKTKYTSLYWNKCNDDERKKLIEEYVKMSQGDQESVEVVKQDPPQTSTQTAASSAATLIKVLSIITIVLCLIGSFVIMSEVGFAVGFAVLLVSLLTGMLAYGIGEMCEQITQINNKLKKQ